MTTTKWRRRRQVTPSPARKATNYEARDVAGDRLSFQPDLLLRQWLDPVDDRFGLHPSDNLDRIPRIGAVCRNGLDPLLQILLGDSEIASEFPLQTIKQRIRQPILAGERNLRDLGGESVRVLLLFAVIAETIEFDDPGFERVLLIRWLEDDLRQHDRVPSPQKEAHVWRFTQNDDDGWAVVEFSQFWGLDFLAVDGRNSQDQTEQRSANASKEHDYRPNTVHDSALMRLQTSGIASSTVPATEPVCSCAMPRTPSRIPSRFVSNDETAELCILVPLPGLHAATVSHKDQGT